MELCIILNKEDVKTNKLGTHYEIRTGNITINFSPEALEEFIKDIQEIKANYDRDKE
jgi:hypothetical protein